MKQGIREHVVARRSQLRPSALEAALLALLLWLIVRQRWIMDDAAIYFRYIDNWLFAGRGLVFNAGEYVEGYTSPLWLLLLAAGRALLPVDYYQLTLGLGLLAGLAAGLGCIALGRRLSGASQTAGLPLILLAGHYGVQTHFTSGLETPLVQLFGVVTALWTVAPKARWLQVMLGLAPLVRPELAIVTLGAGCWLVVCQQRIPWALVLSTLGFNGGWLLFRIYYYADLLPNTYYLKAESNWKQGLYYLAVELEGAWGGLVVLAAVLLLRACQTNTEVARLAPRRARLNMLVFAVAVGLWTVRIGGDMGYHRFFAFSYCLASCATAGLLERLLRGFSRRVRLVAATSVCALVLSSYPWHVLSSHPWRAGSHSMLWHGIEDAMWHRQYEAIRPSPERHAQDEKLRRLYATLPDPSVHKKQAIRAFCSWAWERPDTYVIHTFGLTDAIVARVDSRLRRPGHRDVYAYARALLRAQEKAGGIRGPGLYRRAVARRGAARWMTRSLPTIEIIERKIYNRHHFLENLQLALTPVPSIPR